MGNHLIVYEFIPLGKHYIAVKGENPAKFRCVENIYMLIVALTGVELAVYPQGELYIRSMVFAEPDFQGYYLQKYLAA